MREPNLKVFTAAEREEVMDKVMSLIDAGKNSEASELHRTLPMPAEYLQTLKDSMGIKALVDEGVNLSLAVKQYGKEWLVS